LLLETLLLCSRDRWNLRSILQKKATIAFYARRGAIYITHSKHITAYIRTNLHFAYGKSNWRKSSFLFVGWEFKWTGFGGEEDGVEWLQYGGRDFTEHRLSSNANQHCQLREDNAVKE
jgi:hypothetical protein